MSLGNQGAPQRPDSGSTGGSTGGSRDGVPPTDRRKMALAAVLLLIPVIALMWVPLYARDEPRLFGFPFFFWYQFVWVFLCSALTWTAYRLTLSARRPR